MNHFRTICQRLRSLAQPGAAKREIDDELRFHLEQRTAENLATGMTPEEAARAARKRFGNLQSVREECRDRRSANFGETLLQDFRFGLRMLRKNPGFTAVAVLTLALGIGANTAIFSLLNTAIIRPLPYRDPDRLMVIMDSYPKLNIPAGPLSPWVYFQCRENCKAFEDVGACINWWSPVLTGQLEPEQIKGGKITTNFLQLLGTVPTLGRFFTADDDQSHVAVLSYGLWHRQFGGDTNVIGRTISLDGISYEVVGILPQGFKFTTTLDVLVPIAFTPAERESHAEELLVVGRLKSGATPTQAQVELENNVAKPVRDQSSYHAKHDWKVFAQPLKDNLTADIRPMLVLLLSAVTMVLLIACVNVATLFLAAGIAREKEIAVRTALGAGRFRLVRQLFIEGLALSFFGAAAGLVLSKALTAWIAGLIPESLVHNIAHWDHIQVDIRVLGFTLAATVASVMIFALIPALQISKSNPNQSLKENGNRSSEGVSQRRLRALLVVGEIALATMLLAGAGLVFQSFLRVLRVDPGFDPDQLLTLQVMLPARKYPSLEKRQALLDELLDKAKALPGVSSVALTDNPPFHGGYMMGFSIEGRDDVADAHGAPGSISANYFEAMKIPVLYGRSFTDRDTATSLPVAIIDEKLARRFWPNQSPLGKRLAISFEESSGNPAWREIVGVVGEIKNHGLSTDPKEQYYFPASQMGAGIVHLIDNTYLMIRTKGSPDAIIPALRKQIRSIDPDQPVSYVTTVRSQSDELLAPQRLQSLLVASFAILALGLAGVGLYGVVAYTTRQRTREFGIRLALGAHRKQLVWLVLRQGMKMVAIGLAIGLAGACALGPVLSGFIHEVQPRDIWVFCSAALILAAVALLACLIPAQRATRIDPITALRYQ